MGTGVPKFPLIASIAAMRKRRFSYRIQATYMSHWMNGPRLGWWGNGPKGVNMTTVTNSIRGLNGPTLRSDAADANLGLLGGIVMRLSGWFGEQRRYRQTMNELSALTDRELADIGLTRSDIEDVAQRCARSR
jgi:uncharacterized protein YjiS (DUF1127 family)